MFHNRISSSKCFYFVLFCCLFVFASQRTSGQLSLCRILVLSLSTIKKGKCKIIALPLYFMIFCSSYQSIVNYNWLLICQCTLYWSASLMRTSKNIYLITCHYCILRLQLNDWHKVGVPKMFNEIMCQFGEEGHIFLNLHIKSS